MGMTRKGLEKGPNKESRTEAITNTEVKLQSPKLQSDVLITILFFFFVFLCFLKTKQ